MAYWAAFVWDCAAVAVAPGTTGEILGGLAGLGHSDRGGRSENKVETADGPTFVTMALCLAWLIRYVCDYDKDSVVRARV